MHRNLGPNRFCAGRAPITDFDEPNTYAPNPDWPACRGESLRLDHHPRLWPGLFGTAFLPSWAVHTVEDRRPIVAFGP
jgi:hypothetical protein